MNSFNLFSRGNVLRYKVLSNDELYVLLKDYRENGSKEALEKLINHNLRMIVKIANGFINLGDIEDIRQEALIGFVRAIDSIVLDRDKKTIVPYLWQTTKNCLIVECIRNQNTDKRKIQFFTSSYDRQVSESDDDDLFFLNFLVDKSNIEEEVINRVTIQEFKKILTKKEYYYVERFYGLNGHKKHTAEELSKIANVKFATVTSTLYQARLKLRELFVEKK